MSALLIHQFVLLYDLCVPRVDKILEYIDSNFDGNDSQPAVEELKNMILSIKKELS